MNASVNSQLGTLEARLAQAFLLELILRCWSDRRFHSSSLEMLQIMKKMGVMLLGVVAEADHPLLVKPCTLFQSFILYLSIFVSSVIVCHQGNQGNCSIVDLDV